MTYVSAVDLRKLTGAILGAVADVRDGTDLGHAAYNLHGLLARAFLAPPPDAGIREEFGEIQAVGDGLDAAQEYARGDGGEEPFPRSRERNPVLEWVDSLDPPRAALVRQAVTAPLMPSVTLHGHFAPEESGAFAQDEARELLRAHGCAFFRRDGLAVEQEGEPVTVRFRAGMPREEAITILRAVVAGLESDPDALSPSPAQSS